MRDAHRAPAPGSRLSGAMVAIAIAVGVLLSVPASTARAAVFVVPAFGGQEISLDTTGDGGSGAWTSPGVITIAEQLRTDFPAGQTGVTLVLRAPAGFEFNPGQGTVASLGSPTDLSNLGLDVTANAITVTFTTAASALRFDNLQVADIQVRPTNQAPTAGQIYRPTTGGGTASIVGITTTDDADGAPGVATSFGALSSVGGAPTGPLEVEALNTPNADATGSATTTVTAGTAFALRVTARDQFANIATVDGEATLAFSTNAGDSPNDTAPTVPATAAPTFGLPTFVSGRTEVAGFTLTNAASGQAITVTVQDASGTTLTNGQQGTTPGLTVNPGAVATLAMTTQPVGATAGSALGTQPVLSAVDAFGNATSTAVTGTQLSAAVTGGATLLGTTTVNIVAGAATFTNLQVNVAGDHTLTFTAGAASVESEAFTIAPAAPTQLLVQPLTAGGVPTTTLTAGTAFSVRVTARDAYDNVATQVTNGTVDLAFSTTATNAPDGTAPTVTTRSGAITFESGVGAQTGFVLTNAAETPTVTATVQNAGGENLADPVGGVDGVTGALTVNGGAVAVLTVTTQPAGATAGAAFTTQPVVAARDEFDNPTSTAVTGTRVTATVTGGAALTGTATVDIAGTGTATFAGLRIDTAGSQSLTFTATAGAVSVQSNDFTVSPAAPAAFLVQPLDNNLANGSGTPTTSLVAGVDFAVRVTARDAFANVATQVTGGTRWVFFQTNAVVAPDGSSLPTLPSGVAPSTVAAAFTAGVAEVTGFRFTNAAAGQALTATVPAGAGGTLVLPAVGVTGTSAGATVHAAPLAHFVVAGEDGNAIGTVTAGTSFNIRITARDLFHNTLSSGPNHFHGAGNTVAVGSNVAASAGLGVSAAFTDGVLVHAVTFSGVNNGGATITVTDSAGGLGTGAENGTSAVFTVQPGALAGFLVEADGGGAIGAQLAGASFLIQLTARDAGGNALTFGTHRFDGAGSTAVISSNVGGSAGLTTTAPFTNGVLTGHAVTLTGAGNGTVTVTATDAPGGPGTGAESGTSAAFSVQPAALAGFLVEAAGGGAPGTVTAGAPLTFRVTARDAFDNTLAFGPNHFDGAGNVVVVSANVAASSGLGTSAAFSDGVLASHAVTFTGVNDGGATLTVTDAAGGLGTGVEAGSSAAFTVQPGALDHFEIAAAGGGLLGAQEVDAAFAIRITAHDALGNLLSFGANDFDGPANTVVVSSSVAGSVGLTTTAAFSHGVLAEHTVMLGDLDAAATITVTDSPGGLGTGAETTTSAAFVVGPSSNANLAGLTLSVGTLTPAFSAGTTAYTAAVGNETGSVAVTATRAQGGATILVNGAPASSGVARTVPLAAGMNQVVIVLTAQNGVTTRTYTIDVTRAAAPAPESPPEPPASEIPPGPLPAAGGVQPTVPLVNVVTALTSATAPTSATSGGSRGSLTVTVPAATVPGDTEISVGAIASLTALATQVPPPRGVTLAIAYDVTATGTDGMEITRAVTPPVTLDFLLNAPSIPAGAAARDLVIGAWDGRSWVELRTDVTVQADGHVALSATTSRFAVFAVLWTPDRGRFDRPVEGPRVNAGVWLGGDFADMIAHAPTATAFWVYQDGIGYAYVVGAPAFVNAAFSALFYTGMVPYGTIVLVVQP